MKKVLLTSLSLIAVCLLFVTIIFTACSSNQNMTSSYVQLEDVTPSNLQENLPLNFIFSWKYPLARTTGVKFIINWNDGQNYYSSCNVKRKDDYYYFVPEERFEDGKEYFWFVELLSEATKTSKTYSFKTQNVSEYEFSLYCYNEKCDYEENIWMIIPTVREESANILNIDNVKCFPEVETLLRDETGNQFARWNSVETPASSYCVTLDVEIPDKHICPIINEKLIFDYDKDNSSYTKNTQANEFFQSSHSEIKSKALQIINGETNPFVIVKKLNNWVMQNVEYGQSNGEDALSVLQNKVSGCGGYAALNVAFCRSLGIPARFVSGIHRANFNTGEYFWSPDQCNMGTHCWYEVYFENYGWIQFESTAFNNDPLLYDQRIILGEAPFSINNHDLMWFHLPHVGVLGEYEYQAEVFPYNFILKIKEIS